MNFTNCHSSGRIWGSILSKTSRMFLRVSESAWNHSGRLSPNLCLLLHIFRLSQNRGYRLNLRLSPSRRAFRSSSLSSRLPSSQLHASPALTFPIHIQQNQRTLLQAEKPARSNAFNISSNPAASPATKQPAMVSWAPTFPPSSPASYPKDPSRRGSSTMLSCPLKPGKQVVLRQ